MKTLLDVKGGYMGITRPFDTTWQNGLLVTVYPNGDVIDKTNGEYVRKGSTPNLNKEPQLVKSVGTVADRQTMNINNDLLLLGLILVGIIAITGVVINGKR